jgi:hypothetical protein
MAKYDPLVRFLRRRRPAEELLSFGDIERLIGGLLPKRAHAPAWWSGEGAGPPSPQNWRAAGYDAELVAPETVRFRRRAPEAPETPAKDA